MFPNRLFSALVPGTLAILGVLPAQAGKPTPIPTTANPVANTLQVGSLRLTRCKEVPAYCGSIVRPLDPTGAVAGTINVGFELYPHRDQSKPPLETIAAAEGGPGYPSTATRGSYLRLFGPSMDRRDLLLMDKRGTGKSSPLNCPLVQSQVIYTHQAIAACGAQLGQSSYLFGTGLAADDLAALLDALQTGPVDLYGDSYGTYFSETFAGRHPEKLRTLILDGAYPVIGLSAWYPEIAPAFRHAYDAVCQRSLACQGLTGTSMERITKLLNSVRASPFSGSAPDANGKIHQVTANPASLIYMMISVVMPQVIYRELDAAARAYLDHGDKAPLLRLIAENLEVADGSNADSTPPEYSAALYLAVACSDYPQIYNMTLPVGPRQADRDAAIAQKQASEPGIYSPFTIAEWTQVPLDYSLLDLCLQWPVPSAAYPPAQPVPPGTKFANTPALVLFGEFDDLTPPQQGNAAAALFPNSMWFEVANSFHVTALGDLHNCASKIVNNFVQTTRPGDTSCTTRIPEVRTVPNFATQSGQIPAATALDGNQGTAQDLQVAAAAVLTAGDAISLWSINTTGKSPGFRGGKFAYTSDAAGIKNSFTLKKLQWVDDVAVSGKMAWDISTSQVSATLKLSGSAVSGPGTLTVQWKDHIADSFATITGKIGGRQIRAKMYAP